jgi:hypothetical protein
MTFSARLKEEISSIPINVIEARTELYALLRFIGKFEDNKITVTLENASVARRIYKNIKEIFNINIKVIVRNQKRFRIKQIYILEINEKVDFIKKSLDIKSNYLDTKEEKIAFLRGTFLATGSISDPSTSGYHLEFVFHKLADAKIVNEILMFFNFDSKLLKRSNRYMVYIKSAEEISDVIKLLGAINSLFYFEDIRIYRDHKNMVNRLNNCEIANQEKSLTTGMKQVEYINYLKDNDLLSLLDDNSKMVAEYRLKYPESSYLELAEIISLETDYKIGKSGINHNFIKIKNLVEKHKNMAK